MKKLLHRRNRSTSETPAPRPRSSHLSITVTDLDGANAVVNNDGSDKESYSSFDDEFSNDDLSHSSEDGKSSKSRRQMRTDAKSLNFKTLREMGRKNPEEMKKQLTDYYEANSTLYQETTDPEQKNFSLRLKEQQERLGVENIFPTLEGSASAPTSPDRKPTGSQSDHVVVGRYPDNEEIVPIDSIQEVSREKEAIVHRRPSFEDVLISSRKSDLRASTNSNSSHRDRSSTLNSHQIEKLEKKRDSQTIFVTDVLNSVPNVIMSGFLLSKSKDRGRWKKYWVVLSKDRLYFFTAKEKKKDEVKNKSKTYDLFHSSIKYAGKKEDKYTFDIITLNKKLKCYVESEAEMQEWINKVQNACNELMLKKLGQNSLPASPTSSNSIEQKDKIEYTQEQIEMRELLHVPGNDICADCSTPNPEWISINLGIFICIKCSGIHRSLGVHITKVRSLTLDNLERENVETVKLMGNIKANSIWEANVPQSMVKPTPTSDIPSRQKWINEKYVKKTFMDPAALEAEKKRQEKNKFKEMFIMLLEEDTSFRDRVKTMIAQLDPSQQESLGLLSLSKSSSLSSVNDVMMTSSSSATTSSTFNNNNNINDMPITPTLEQEEGEKGRSDSTSSQSSTSNIHGGSNNNHNNSNNNNNNNIITRVDSGNIVLRGTAELSEEDSSSKHFSEEESSSDVYTEDSHFQNSPKDAASPPISRKPRASSRAARKPIPSIQPNDPAYVELKDKATRGDFSSLLTMFALEEKRSMQRLMKEREYQQKQKTHAHSADSIPFRSHSLTGVKALKRPSVTSNHFTDENNNSAETSSAQNTDVVESDKQEIIEE